MTVTSITQTSPTSSLLSTYFKLRACLKYVYYPKPNIEHKTNTNLSMHHMLTSRTEECMKAVHGVGIKLLVVLGIRTLTSKHVLIVGIFGKSKSHNGFGDYHLLGCYPPSVSKKITRIMTLNIPCPT